VVYVRASGIAALAVTILLLAAASGHAQAPPPLSPPAALPSVPGFVPSYEIMRTLRSAGFEPLAPPLREGSTYVVRANDYRGILMRVVLDARTGAIRDANRIVPGPGSDARLGMLPPYEEAPDTMPPPEVTGALPPPRPVQRAIALPPLPRPRPAELAANPAGALTPAVATAAKPDTKPDVTGSVPAVVPAPPVAAPVPAVAEPSRVPPPLTINN
jgi:hypothetical protein